MAPPRNTMKHPQALKLMLCHAFLTGACSIDSELSPDIPARSVRSSEDEDAGKRIAKKIAADLPTPATNPDPHAAQRGPYYQSDPWQGYLWVAKNGRGTTLTPSESFADKVFEAPVCITGSVAATPDSGANAMLGMNVHQARRTDATPLALEPSLDGVQVAVKNRKGSPLRVQVAAQDGTTNPLARWCAPVSGSGGFIPWTAFNTACWDGSGKAYRNEPITVAMLLVPGNAQAPVPYDFCLERLAESEAPLPGVGAGSPPADDE